MMQAGYGGGLSSFVSSVSIYEEIERLSPRLAQVLMTDFYVDRKGEVPPGKKPYYRLPVFHRTEENRVICIYDRSFISAAQRWTEVPRLTQEQEEALDLLEEVASSDRLRFDMMLEPGDLQLLHNHQCLHARSEFFDGSSLEERRHLLRLWICPRDGIALPSNFCERFGSVEAGNRGGMPCKELVAPLDAC